MNPTVQEVIDELIDQKAALMRRYLNLKPLVVKYPRNIYPQLFDLEEQIEELNDKYKLLMEYAKCQK